MPIGVLTSPQKAKELQNAHKDAGKMPPCSCVDVETDTPIDYTRRSTYSNALVLTTLPSILKNILHVLRKSMCSKIVQGKPKLVIINIHRKTH